MSNRALSVSYVVRDFYAREIIFLQGSKANEAYIVKEGRIEISIQRKDKSVVLNNLGRGEVFGEMALISEGRLRSATAKAVVASKLVVIDRDTFVDFLKESSPFVASIIRALVDRLNNAIQRIADQPDLFLAMAHIFNLFADHKQIELDHNETVNAFAKALNVESSDVEKDLSLMKNYGLIDLAAPKDGVPKKIHLLKGDNNNRFIEESKKAHQKQK